MSGRLEDKKLVAYIDGELSDEEREEIEKVLEIDESSRQALADLRAQREMADNGTRNLQNLGDESLNSSNDKPSPSSDEKESIDTDTSDTDDEEAFTVFSCGNCQAKYTIAVEKVKGKVFRVNCKKCGEPIIIRGDTETPSDAPPLRYSSIPERPSLIGAPMSSFEPGILGPNKEDSGLSSAKAALSDGSLFSSDMDSEGEHEAESAQKESTDRVSLDDIQSGVGPSVPAESQTMATSQTSSVLFSRSGLENLAASSAKAETKPRSSPSFLDESSGLIDIRALSSPIYVKKESDYDDDDIMSLGAAPASFNPPVLKAQSTEKMNMWMKITILSCVVVVLAVGGILWKTTMSSENPQATSQQIVALQEKLEKLQKLQKKNFPLPVAVSGEEKDPSHGPEIGNKTADRQVVKKSSAGPAQSAKSDQGAYGSDTRNFLPSGNWAKKPRKSQSESDNKTVSADEEASPVEADPKPPSEESSSDIPVSPYASPSEENTSLREVDSARKANKEIDALLGQEEASEPRPSASQESMPTASSAVRSAAKPKLERGDVQKGMNGVADRVKACAQGQLGRVTVKVVIGQTGRVASAVSVGPFAGTAVGSCAAKAVRKAKFPISQTTLTVKYPFNLQ